MSLTEAQIEAMIDRAVQARLATDTDYLHEIAQRQALHEANCAVAVLGRGGDASVYARAAIDAYLTAMRREWKPEAIEIGEDDHIVVAIDGQELELHNVHGLPVMRALPDAGTIDITITKQL